MLLRCAGGLEQCPYDAYIFIVPRGPGPSKFILKCRNQFIHSLDFPTIKEFTESLKNDFISVFRDDLLWFNSLHDTSASVNAITRC